MVVKSFGIAPKENRKIRETEIAALCLGAYLTKEYPKAIEYSETLFSVSHALYKNSLCLIKCTLEEAGR